MSFPEAIKTCLRKYAVFGGRASRSEFWWFALAYYAFFLLILPLLVVMGRGSTSGEASSDSAVETAAYSDHRQGRRARYDRADHGLPD
jgi:uncharacterized membrane protein YhaH (DUF805 family)